MWIDEKQDLPAGDAGEEPEVVANEDDLADFDDVAAGVAAPVAADAGEGEGTDAGAAGTGEAAGDEINPDLLKAVAGEDDGASGPMIPKARFDEVNGALKELRTKVDAMQQEREAAAVKAQARDFAAEKAALRDARDNGDLTDDEYLDKRDALVIEEAEQRAAVKLTQLQAEQQRVQREQAWQQRITAWEAANADFLSNAIRRDAVERLMAKYGQDASLSDEALIARVEAEAFEAFGFAREVADATKAAAERDPHQSRNAKDAKAQARASSAPAFGSGSSDRGRKSVPGMIGLGDKDWNNLPKEVRESDQLADF